MSLTYNMTINFTNISMGLSGETFESPFKFFYTKLVFILAYSGVFSFCFFGNLMVLFAIGKSARLRSMTNFFLANLALADFCVGVFCVLPNLSTFLSPNWVLGKAMCKIYYFVWNLCYTASIIILTAIATERYIAIKYPLRARRCLTSRRITMSQIIIWLVAAIYSVPYLIIFDTFSVSDFDGSTLEYCFYQYELIDMKVFATINFIVWYSLPLLLMSVMYAKIGTTLWRTCSTQTKQIKAPNEMPEESYCTSSTHSSDCPAQNIKLQEYTSKKSGSCDSEMVLITTHTKSGTKLTKIRREKLCSHCAERHKSENATNHCTTIVGNSTPSNGNGSIVSRDGASSRYRINLNSGQTRVSSLKAVRSRRKVIRLLIAVIVSFAVCVLPHHIRLLLQYWNVQTIFNLGVFPPISFLILYLNSALNPVLYALFSANFRKSFKEIIPCRIRRRGLPMLIQDTKTGSY